MLTRKSLAKHNLLMNVVNPKPKLPDTKNLGSLKDLEVQEIHTMTIAEMKKLYDESGFPVDD